MTPIITKIITGIDAAAVKTVRLLLSVESQNKGTGTTDRLDFMPTRNPETFISIRSKTMRLEKNLLGIQVLARKEHTNGNTNCLAAGSFTFLFFDNLESGLFKPEPETNLMIFSDN